MLKNAPTRDLLGVASKNNTHQIYLFANLYDYIRLILPEKKEIKVKPVMHYNNTRNGRRSITKKTEQGSKSAN
jgi:hypothetical protein